MKKILILNASDDIEPDEIKNIVSQISMYRVKADIYKITEFQNLYSCLKNGEKYDYIYLATHGCETSFGNISGTVNVNWTTFAALVCITDVAKPGAIFLHSCCRGGLNQVAWQMFSCCDKIEYVCGPRHDVFPVDLITAFNLFLYNIEVKKIDPVRSAEKVLLATDVRLVCFDSIECSSDYSYQNYCESLTEDIENAFDEIAKHEEKENI